MLRGDIVELFSLVRWARRRFRWALTGASQRCLRWRRLVGVETRRSICSLASAQVESATDVEIIARALKRQQWLRMLPQICTRRRRGSYKIVSTGEQDIMYLGARVSARLLRLGEITQVPEPWMRSVCRS